MSSRDKRRWYVRIFERMRAWFVTWRDINVGNKTSIIILMASEIEKMDWQRDTVQDHWAAKRLKHQIKAAATAAGLEKKLNKIIRRHVDPKEVG